MNSVLIISLISIVLLVHLTVVARRLVADARAGPDGIDALTVRLTLAARLRGMLTRLHISVLTIAIHTVHL